MGNAEYECISLSVSRCNSQKNDLKHLSETGTRTEHDEGSALNYTVVV